MQRRQYIEELQVGDLVELERHVFSDQTTWLETVEGTVCSIDKDGNTIEIAFVDGVRRAYNTDQLSTIAHLHPTKMIEDIK